MLKINRLASLFKTVFVVLLLMVLCLHTSALGFESPQTTALKTQLAKADDAAKTPLLLALSKAYGLDFPQTAYTYAARAQLAAQQQGQDQLQVEALLLCGRFLRYLPNESERAHNTMDEALAMAQQQQFKALECAILLEKASLAWWDFNSTQYDSIVRQANDLAHRLGSPKYLGMVARRAGMAAYQRYHTDSAFQLYQEALAQSELAKDELEVMKVKMDLAMVHLRKREGALAQQLIDEARETAKERQSTYWQVMTLINTNIVYISRRDSLSRALLEPNTQQLIAIASRCENAYAQVKFTYYMTRMLRQKGNGDEAITYGEQYLELASRLNIPTHFVQASYHLAKEYLRKGKLDQSLELTLNAKDIALAIDFKVTQLYDLISRLYRTSDNLPKALEYIDKQMAYERERGFRVGYYFLYECYFSYASIYRDLDSFDLAYPYLDSALAIAIENEDLNKQLDAYVAISSVSYESGDYPRAKKEFITAKEALNKAGVNLNNNRNSHFYTIGSVIFFKTGDYKEAIAYGEQALACNRGLNWSSAMADNHNLLRKAYEANGNYPKALYHLKQHKSINDSLFNVETSEKLLALQEQFEAGEKQHQIELLESEKALAETTAQNQQEAASRSKLMLLLVIVCAIVLLIAGLLFFNRYKLAKQATELKLENERLLLEEQNQQVAQELEMMEMRSAFFTNVSHEIRTPLTLIKGPLEMLRQNPNLLSSEWISSMERNTDRLIKLVDQALRLGKDKDWSAPFVPETVEFAPFVEALTQSFGPLALQKEIDLSVENRVGRLRGAIDQELLETALINLLGNAFRYTPAGGQITIVLAEEEENLCISVQDTGEGIAEEHLPHLFERYYRAKEQSSTGFGLGLSLVREAMAAHQGSISVTSKPGVGTTFHLQLPLVAAEPSPTEALSSAIAPAHFPEIPPTHGVELHKKATLLVVEDHAEIRQFLVDLLRQEYFVIAAVNGHDGEEQARQAMPDLIISDVMMPERDGYELVQHLKNEVHTSHIPILLLTAKATHEAKVAGLKVGADDYLYKPVSPEELLLRVANLLKQRDRLQQWYATQTGQHHPKAAEANPPALNVVDTDFIERAHKIIEEHLLDEQFTIVQFCEEVALNRTSVHHKLKTITGLNTTGFIKSVRIRKAKELINGGNHNLMEVATLTGFTNRHTFNRAFKEHTGKTPSAYRNEVLNLVL